MLDWHGEAGFFSRWGRPRSPAHLGSKGSSRGSSRTELMTVTYVDEEYDDLVIRRSRIEQEEHTGLSEMIKTSVRKNGFG
jgi:hypothetical protein